MDRREALLDATHALVREVGIAGVTTKRIAEAASVSEGTLYNHFANKDELLTAVMRERMPAFVRQVLELPGRAGTGTVEGHLTDLLRAALAFYAEVAPMLGNLLGDPVLLDDARQRPGGHGMRRGVETVASYLTAERDLGRLAGTCDPASLATLLLGAAFHEAVARTIEGGDPPVRDTFPRRTVRTALRAHT